MDSRDELRSPSRPTSPAASIIILPLPSTLFVLQLLGTIRCPEKPRAAHWLFHKPTSTPAYSRVLLLRVVRTASEASASSHREAPRSRTLAARSAPVDTGAFPAAYGGNPLFA